MLKSIAITEEQQQQFDEDGFILIEDALSPVEVEELIEVVDKLDGRYRREKGIGPAEPL